MEYLIENPNTAYAREYIRHLHRRFGARAVCFYTSPEALSVSRRRHPEMFDRELVAAHYLAPPEAFPALIAHLRSQHRIVGVIPHQETYVGRAVDLAEALGLDWVQPTMMRRFRDKLALKNHLRVTDPGLRLNFAALAHSPRAALDLARRQGLSQFVLKPNDGYGNVNVGIFAAGDPLARVEDYWRRTGATSVLLEEFIGGPDYHCNGQVDADGGIVITDVGISILTETGHREVVCRRTDQVRTFDPVFAPIERYTRRMIAASGLRRSPFHAEVRIDDTGPCLLECAARIIGGSWVRCIDHQHGAAFQVLDLAGHYYLSSAPYGPAQLDWERYDSMVLTKIRGVATRSERIEHLEGVAETERLPQFLEWMKKPLPGQRLVTTTNLLTSPYEVLLRGESPAEVEAVESQVRSQIRWNSRPPTWRERAVFLASQLPDHLRWRLQLDRRTGDRLLDRRFTA